MFSYLLNYYPSGLISISSFIGLLFAIYFGLIFIVINKYKSDKKNEDSKTSNE